MTDSERFQAGTFEHAGLKEVTVTSRRGREDKLWGARGQPLSSSLDSPGGARMNIAADGDRRGAPFIPTFCSARGAAIGSWGFLCVRTP